MQVGTQIDYRLRIRGLPIRWQSMITAWNPPFRFVDEQIRGPYQRWHHEHTFAPADGGTVIRDVVDYRGPGWLLEPLVTRLFVGPDVDRIFAYRRERLVAMYRVVAKPQPIASDHTARGTQGGPQTRPRAGVRRNGSTKRGRCTLCDRSTSLTRLRLGTCESNAQPDWVVSAGGS